MALLFRTSVLLFARRITERRKITHISTTNPTTNLLQSLRFSRQLDKYKNTVVLESCVSYIRFSLNIVALNSPINYILPCRELKANINANKIQRVKNVLVLDREILSPLKVDQF